MDVEKKLKDALTEVQRAKASIGSDLHLGGNLTYSYNLVHDVEKRLKEILNALKS